MRAACKAAGAAHAGGEFGQRFFDADSSGLCPLARDNPADPFVSS